MSYYLSQAGREHVILERGRVGERWRSERWDSFCFRFPNWTIDLPGHKYECDDPDAFAPGGEGVRFMAMLRSQNIWVGAARHRERRQGRTPGSARWQIQHPN
jgi:cation diffusion facilitator CzcD-associated flavoprotein CzcO